MIKFDKCVELIRLGALFKPCLRLPNHGSMGSRTLTAKLRSVHYCKAKCACILILIFRGVVAQLILRQIIQLADKTCALRMHSVVRLNRTTSNFEHLDQFRN